MTIMSRTLEATENLEQVDSLASAAQRQVSRVILEGQPAERLLGGSWLGHPLHPLLVVIPIGSWLSATILDLLGQESAAQRLTITGVIGAPVAALAGAADFRQLDRRTRRVGFIHGLSNLAATGCFAASYVLRRSGRIGAGRLWSTLGLVALGAGGSLGGHLTYAQGVGVFRWQPERRRRMEEGR